ncbi:MAG: histone deacetylase family protein [Pseudomonadota bacterium]
MKIFHSDRHRLRDAQTELDAGRFVRPYESPSRVEMVRAELERRGLGPFETPGAFGRAAYERIHDPLYLAFLESAWADWAAAKRGADGAIHGEAIPNIWPSRRMGRRPDLSRPDLDIEVKLGWYALAAETAISNGTWEAACASADLALSAQAAVAEAAVAGGAPAAFALCRPPGHHAAADMFGGYCFLNNAALAAQGFIDQGAGRVAVLDVDFHHGNGTQSIFYERADVLTVSIHGDPDFAFPYYLGAADETGAGAGEGANLNLPLAKGAAWDAWSGALDQACARIEAFGAAALVVSLGVDAYEGDPISQFRLTGEDFIRMGARIGGLRRPTVLVMEGGYAVEAIGVNVANALEGLAGA